MTRTGDGAGDAPQDGAMTGTTAATETGTGATAWRGIPPAGRRAAAGLGTGLAAAAVLVVGLVAGGTTVALLDDPDPDPDPAVAAEADDPVDAEERSGPRIQGGTVTGQVRVDAACLRAVNAAQDAFTVLDEFGQAASTLDAARLDEVVRQLQPLRDRLESGLAACDVVPVAGPSGSAGPAGGTAGPAPATPTG